MVTAFVRIEREVPFQRPIPSCGKAQFRVVILQSWGNCILWLYRNVLLDFHLATALINDLCRWDNYQTTIHYQEDKPLDAWCWLYLLPSSHWHMLQPARKSQTVLDFFLLAGASSHAEKSVLEICVAFKRIFSANASQEGVSPATEWPLCWRHPLKLDLELDASSRFLLTLRTNKLWLKLWFTVTIQHW